MATVHKHCIYICFKANRKKFISCWSKNGAEFHKRFQSTFQFGHNNSIALANQRCALVGIHVHMSRYATANYAHIQSPAQMRNANSRLGGVHQTHLSTIICGDVCLSVCMYSCICMCVCVCVYADLMDAC